MMAWSREVELNLVDLVRRRPCLYNEECESFHDSKMKNDVAREIATIISSTRPGTTVEDVLKKWESLCTKFATYHKKVLDKKKPRRSFPFINKMDFMKNHLGLGPESENSVKVSKEKRKSTTDRKMTGADERSPTLELQQVDTSCNGEISDVEKDACEEQPCGSTSAISIYSDNSPVVTNKNLELYRSKRRKFSAISSSPRDDVSEYTMASPLANANDTILDRTEPYTNGYRSFDNGNGSIVSRRTSRIEDEDELYASYIACRLRKLDGSRKLAFKVTLEKMFYETFEQ